jgi:hypothetical protein
MRGGYQRGRIAQGGAVGERGKQRERILETLEAHGWRRTAIDRKCDWWADEFWRLSWSGPAGTRRACLVFLVDEQWKGARRPGEGVASLAVSAAQRKERAGWDFEMPLGRRWERGLDELVAALLAIRSTGDPDIDLAEE